MTPEQWHHIKQVFQAALELPADERAPFIERASGEDAWMRGQIESLLRAHQDASDFIEAPPLVEGDLLDAAFLGRSPTTEPMDDDYSATERRIGAYRLVREIGRGGMGTVYLAERADGAFRQQVAVKLIKRGMDTDFVLRRFRNERQILAALDHPHIGRLLGGGTTDDGLPYFLMEYIAGAQLYEHCDRERLTTRERLKLFCQICDAVAYAHRNGVVHRDIKPSNILIAADGTPKLLDFGIAKLLNPDLAAQTLDPTLTALRLMTPEYASPEQVCGGEITKASDIYSLGVVLYELLTGHRPYVFKNRSPHELSRVVCEEEPELPSRVVSRSEARTLLPVHAGAETTLDRICHARRVRVDELQNQLAGNLDRITLKALRKETTERYARVEDLYADITRHLDGHPVSASFRFGADGEGRPAARRRAGDTGEESALAVLPFKLLNPSKTGETGDDYLGLGLADALITRISALRRVVVRPTSSVLRFRDDAAGDPVAAGRALGASFVLDGRILRLGERIRVTVQLLEVATGATRWAERFDERFTDVLNLQDELTERVAESLLPRLSGDEREQLAKRGTDDAEAFEAYLRGRYHWSTFTEEGFAKAITCYYRAIACDPNYALAYSGIADYYNWLGVYGVLPSAECFAAAREAAEQAIRLDDTLAEAYTALGFALLGSGYLWEEAERQHLRALELNPACAPAYVWYALQLGMEGRFDEAVTKARRSVELDPLAPFNRYNLGWILYHARRFDESLEAQRALIRDEPNYAIAHFGCGWALAALGRYDEAVASLRRATEMMPGVTFVCAALAVVHARTGDEAAARRILTQMRADAAQRVVSPFHFALVHAALGEREEAFACLEQTYEIGDAWLTWLGVEPQFDSLRDDSRVAELLRRSNNPSIRRLSGIPEARRAGSQSASKQGGDTNVAGQSPTTDPPPTDNTEAHQLYVAGRYYSTRRTAEGMRQAIIRLERAVELDPRFALAYAELADSYALLNWYVEPPPPDAFEKARQAALRAIEVDPDLADAHASLGLVKLHYERDWEGAEREFRRAIELKPENPVAHRWYAFSLSAMNRHDEAVAEIRRAQKISPRSAVIATAVANVLFLARRFDEAITQCRNALELDAGSVAAYVVQRWAYEAKGMKEEALAAFEQERTFAGETPTTHAKRVHVLAACGRHEEARGALGELLSRREEQGVTSYELGVIYSLLGDKDSAFRWLAQAERQHAVGFTFVRVDPHLDNLRDDPRFDELLRQANILPPPAEEVVTDATTSGSSRGRSIHNTADAEARGRQTGGRGLNIAASSPPPRSASVEVNHTVLNAPQTFDGAKRRRLTWAAAALAFVLIAASGLALFTRSGGQQSATTTSSSSFQAFQAGQSAKLTTTGNAVGAAISPDGKYVAYTIEEGGRQSLWVRQTTIANSVRVVPPAAIDYRGLTFSPDGAFIYYVAAEKSGPNSRGALYKVPVLGGSALMVKENVDSPVALAPDGKRFAFVRRDAAQGADLLLVADEADAGGREIARRSFPEHISTAPAPAWSARDDRIAFAAETGDARGPYMKPAVVRLADGRGESLSARRWLNVGQMGWLPDGKQLVVAAQEENSSFTQLWQLAAGNSGAQGARPLTNDLADYRGVSLSADGAALVAVRREMLTSVSVAPVSTPDRLTQITTGAGRYFDCSWTPGGKILYASDTNGSADIWEMDPSGTGQRQLTASAGRNYAPVSSPDNERIFFHSDRSGSWQIWSMRREDGGDARQVTRGGGDGNWAQLTPDGKWVIYEHTRANAPVTLWRLPLGGGEPSPLTDKLATRPAISPDGRLLAYWQRDDDNPGAPWRIAVKPLGDDSAPARTLDVPQGVANGVTILRWTRDGRAVMYLDYRDGTTILWRQPLDGSAPARMLESPGNVLIHSFDLSSDNRLVLSRGLMINDVVIIGNAAKRPE